MSQSNYRRKPRNNRNYQNKGSQNKSYGKSEEFYSDKERKANGTNDPAWYSKYPELVSDTASLFFSTPLGARIERLSDAALHAGNYIEEPSMYAFPGIMSIHVVTGPGASYGNSSPVNAISRGIYSYIRHANSGSKNYDAPDLMMYLLTIDNMYSMWAKFTRVYGMARYFNVRSRYLAKYFLNAMEVDADDILSNMAQLRYAINQFAVQISNFCAPAAMDYFKRHTQMFMNVYKDSEDSKSQDYIIDTAGYYVYDKYNGKCVFKAWPTNMKLSDIENIFAEVLSPIVGNEDFNIMSGDILKAYGADKVWAIPLLPADYITPIIKDDVMLSQIENAVSIRDTFTAGSVDIIQDPSTGALLWKPNVQGTNMELMPKKVINLHWQNPTPMDIMEASRFMFNIAKDEAGTGYDVVSSGTEIITGYSMYSFTSPNVLTPYVLYQAFNYSELGTVGTMKTLSMLNNFAWHPRVSMYTTLSSSGQIMLIYDSVNADNFTEIDDNIVYNLNNVALLSLFDVDHFGLAK